MVCIELLGMSRAGKTTQKNGLLKKLNDEGVNAITIERPKIPFSSFGSIYDFHRFLFDYLRREIDANSDKELVILDRGIHDRGVLLDFDYRLGEISGTEYRSLKRDLVSAESYIDQGFVFMVSPEESIRRWSGQVEAGMDSSYLNTGLNTGDNLRELGWMHGKYESLLANSKLQKIDGARSIEENHRQIAEAIYNGAKR